MAIGMLAHRDPLLRRHACRLLALCCQHDAQCAGWVPQKAQKLLVSGLSGADDETCQFAAALLQSLARASRPMASTLFDLGAVPPLVAQLQQCARGQSKGSPQAAAAALGHICDAQPDAAKAALEHGAIAVLASLLGSGDASRLGQPPHVCAVLCACLGALAAPEPAHTAPMVRAGCLHAMAGATLLARRPPRAAALAVARGGFARVAERCGEGGEGAYQQLVWLVETLPYPSGSKGGSTPPPGADDEAGPEDGGRHGEATVLAALFKGLAAVLTKEGAGEQRLDFVQRGALAHVQQALRGTPALQAALQTLNGVYPGQMVQATDPKYETKLLDMIKG